MLLAIILIMAHLGLGQDLNQGITFIPQGELYASNEFWTIAINLNFNDYNDISKELVKRLKSLSTELKEAGTRQDALDTGILQTAVAEHEVLEHRLGKVEQDIENLMALYPISSNREKRGLINLGGDVLKFLFGTPDSDDLQAIEEKIQHVKLNGDKFISVFKAQASVLNASYELISENQKAILKLTQVSKILVGEFSKIKQFAQKTAEYYVKATHFVMTIQTSLRIIGGMIANLQITVDEIYEALNVAAMERLSPSLISTNEMFVILTSVQAQLPSGWTFVNTLNKHDLFNLYQSALVRVASCGNLFKIFVKIPLVSETRKFKLYRAHELPVRISQNLFSAISPDTPFLAISNDGNRYMTMNFDDLTLCHGSQVRICPPHAAIRTGQNLCLTALFRGEYSNLDLICRKRIYKNPDAVFYKIQGEHRWVYSVPKAVKARISCINGKQNFQLLNNTGLLTTEPGCEVLVNGDVLLPDSSQAATTKIELFREPIFMPSLDSIDNDSIKFPTLNNEFDIQKIDNLLQSIHLHKSGIPLEQLESILTTIEINNDHATNTWWVYGILGLMGISIGVCALWRGRNVWRRKFLPKESVELEELNRSTEGMLSLPDGRQFSVKLELS